MLSKIKIQKTNTQNHSQDSLYHSPWFSIFRRICHHQIFCTFYLFVYLPSRAPQTGFPLFYLPAPRTLLGTCGSPIKVYNPTSWHRQAEAEPILAGQGAGWARGGGGRCLLAKDGQYVGGICQPARPRQVRGLRCPSGEASAWSHQLPAVHNPKGSFETPPLHLEMTLENPGVEGTVNLAWQVPPNPERSALAFLGPWRWPRQPAV